MIFDTDVAIILITLVMCGYAMYMLGAVDYIKDFIKEWKREFRK